MWRLFFCTRANSEKKITRLTTYTRAMWGVNAANAPREARVAALATSLQLNPQCTAAWHHTVMLRRMGTSA